MRDGLKNGRWHQNHTPTKTNHGSPVGFLLHGGIFVPSGKRFGSDPQVRPIRIANLKRKSKVAVGPRRTVKMASRTIGCLLAVALLLFPQLTHAASALQTVEIEVNELLSVLGDKSLSGATGEDKKKAAVRTISDRLFDFGTLSKFTLGRDWKKLAPDQQKEFVVLYRRLLESVYMGRLLEYKDEKVVFLKEKKLADKRTEVQSQIVTDTKEIPINYRLILRDGQWKVYDLIIENVSLVKNYRSQFGSILKKKSPDELLEILREKTQTSV